MTAMYVFSSRSNSSGCFSAEERLAEEANPTLRGGAGRQATTPASSQRAFELDFVRPERHRDLLEPPEDRAQVHLRAGARAYRVRKR